LKNENLLCSLFRINKNRKGVCVVYLHGNSGNRTSCLDAVRHLCLIGIPVVGFDFSGCGYSDGKYVTLGKILLEVSLYILGLKE